MVVAKISKNALLNNIKVIKERCAKESQIIWVLKADAYGHGAEDVAKLFNKNDFLAVARLKEALNLRNNGVMNRILILGGVFSEHELGLVAIFDIDIVVHSIDQLTALVSIQLAVPLNVWLKVDTGMHRLGISYAEASFFLNELEKSENVMSQIGVISHFSTADLFDNHAFTEQLEIFDILVTECKKKHSIIPSIANSAAFFRDDNYHFSYSRIGLALYGISPFEHISAKDLGLIPAMTLESILISVKLIKAGDYVGYGEHWSSSNSTIIGVVAVGYGDGYPRNIKKSTYVLINGRRANIIGVSCMDMLMIDLGANSKEKVGDKVILWGNELPVEEVAFQLGTIPYELLTRVSKRVDRIFK